MNTWTPFSVGTGSIGGNLPAGTNSIFAGVLLTSVPSTAAILYDDVSFNASLPIELLDFTVK